MIAPLLVVDGAAAGTAGVAPSPQASSVSGNRQTGTKRRMSSSWVGAAWEAGPRIGRAAGAASRRRDVRRRTRAAEASIADGPDPSHVRRDPRRGHPPRPWRDQRAAFAPL